MSSKPPFARLFIREPNGSQRTVVLTKQENRVGRTMEAEVCFPGNPNVSRNHARIYRKNGTVVIEDLGSKNGTWVNKKRVKSTLLEDGARIELGKVEMLFRLDRSMINESKTGRIVLRQDKAADMSNATVIKSLDSVLDRFSDDDVPSDTVHEPPPEAVTGHQETAAPRHRPGSSGKLGKDGLKLKLLFEISKELISIKPLHEFLEQVVELVFQVVDAERVVLMMKEDGEPLTPRVLRMKDGDEESEPSEVQISKTITDKVVREKIAILTTDAQSDERFQGGASIVMMGIRSAMCVPLLVGEKVLGVIYVDSRMSSKLFDEDDLALLSAFANQAAIGIEQARLNEKIREEIAVRSSLERYHSPEVIASLMDSGGRIKPEVKEITILYADIKGFTTITETMSPDDVAELLNEYYSVMTTKIFNHEGTLDKFMGDAVMAIFGSPVAHPDDPLRAVRAAVEMQQALVELNDDRPEDKRYTIRIGINTGKAITGEFGSDQRVEFTALGNTVNIAARIEHQVASPGQVAIGETTWQRAREEFETQSLGTFTVKGIKKPIKVFEVMFDERPNDTLTQAVSPFSPPSSPDKSK